MPQILENINKLNQSNYPGCLYIDIISSDDIPLLPTNTTNITANLMPNPEKWLRINPKNNSIQFNVAQINKNGQRLFQAKIAAVVSKTTVNLTQKFFTLGYQRFCALVTTINGNRLLLGNKQFPATLQLTNKQTGAPVNTPNQNNFELAVTSKAPVYNYTGPYTAPAEVYIDKLTEKNYPGCLYLDICPAEYMMNYDDTKFFVSDNIMNNYQYWIRIYFATNTLNFVESIDVKNGGRTFVSQISGQLSKISQQLLNQLFLLGYSRFVAIVTDRNQQRHIVGAPAEPAILTLPDITPGNYLSNTNKIDFVLSCQRNRPSKTYQGVVILPGDGTEEGDGGNQGPISSQNAIKWPDFTPILWPDLTEIEWQ